MADDGAATSIGNWSASPGGVPVGTRSAVGGRNVLTMVAETGKPARMDDYEGASGEAAEIARKHGWRSSDTAELHFDECRIPAEDILGQEGRGFYAIMGNFQNERVTIGAMAMGEAQAALDLTLDYVRTRKAFGGPLWTRETVEFRRAGRVTACGQCGHLQ